MNHSNKLIVVVSVSLVTTGLSACRTTHTTAVPRTREMISSVNRDSLVYELYRHPVVNTKRSEKEMKFSIRIINKKGGDSPLRRLCTDIYDYNTYYEYLLNQAKNDLLLIQQDKYFYPVAYSFENNYNAFPFETINIGYRLEGKHRKTEDYRLLFVDKVFSKDTLSFGFKN